MLYAKILRQVNRLDKNQTKATRLTVKQECNKLIKKFTKERSRLLKNNQCTKKQDCLVKLYSDIKQKYIK